MNHFKQAGNQLGLNGSGTTVCVAPNNAFKDKPFYCWDTEFLGYRHCCFNHLIGLPQKDFDYKPLFPYELDVCKAWEQNMHIWIKKATGLGISEFFLRMMLWLCLHNDDYQGCQMCIVTGPNIDLAKKLIRRMRNMIKDYRFDTETDYALEVNKCWIQAYPSHNLGSFRSLDKCKFIFLDEADFFPVGQLQDVRDVSERYIAKSNPWIVMVSTPNRPGGLFEQIELEQDCIYHRMFLDYTYGLNKIYSQKDIEKAKQSPSFEREYNLKYGWGLGNFALPREIDQCIVSEEIKLNPNCSVALGCDPGFGSSKFAVTVIQLQNNKLEVIYSHEFSRPSYEEMIRLVTQLKAQFHPQKIYIDKANPDMIRSVKTQCNEALDYERIIERAKKDKIDYSHRMFVVPISFSESGPELLNRFRHVISKGWIRIPKQYNDLIVQIRMAKAKDNGNLDKNDTSDSNTYDLFDSARLALEMFPLTQKR